MKRLAELLFQIDEACRYITDGRQAPLRLALMLLDNAIELQMDWAIEAELRDHDFREKLRVLALQLLDSPRLPDPQCPIDPTDLQWLIDWQPLSQKQKQRIDRDFNEKVEFLARLPDKVAPAVQGPLKYLHRYRNEAYHRGEVRPATLPIACRLLVEINSELLLSLHAVGKSYASDGDYSWLEGRFGVRPMRILGDQTFLQMAADDFRRQVLLDESALSVALADHLETRVADLLGALSFILESISGPNIDSLTDVFRASQYWAAVRRGEVTVAPMPPVVYKPPFTLNVLDDVLARRNEITSASTRLDAFRAYSNLEEILETFEDDVYSLTADIDRALQAEIDRARGK